MAVLGVYLGKSAWFWRVLYHSSTDLFPHQELVRRSNLSLPSFDLDLQKSLNFFQIVSGISSLVNKLQETYWSMQKSPLQAITFLHFLLSDNTASSHSKIFSHFKCYFRNLWHRPSFTVRSILGPQYRAWTYLESVIPEMVGEKPLGLVLVQSLTLHVHWNLLDFDCCQSCMRNFLLL